MKKAIILSGLLLAVSVSLAAAQGINLRLNDCGYAGTVNAPALCTSNNGLAMTMVGSAMPPAGMDRVVACEGFIDAVTNQATLSPWWQFEVGGCRMTSLTFGFDFTAGPYNCADFWAGGATGGGGISPYHQVPYRFTIRLVVATPDEHPIEPDVEFYLFKVNINRAKSTGTGACAGCTDAVCFVMNKLTINQPAGVGDANITNPIVGNYVTYNGGAVFAGCPGATPAQNRTWGQVKSLYR